MYEVKAGDFILSGIDARNGAFGIVPDELDGAVVTNDFWYFKVDEEVIDKHLFLELTSADWFDDICRKGSDGTTQRIRLQKDKFFNQPVTLPPREQQPALRARLLNSKQTIQDLAAERKKQSDLLSKLRQAILQEAIQGKLTADLPCRQAGWRDSTFRNYSGKWVPENGNQYFAYVLECANGSLYKGSTMNLFERINRHLEGRGGEWTRKHKPIRLIHFEEYATQEEAVKREKHFKSGSGREWLEQIKAEREKENEPASELLKRIAAEKAELVKAKKIRKHPPAGRAGKPLPPITDDDLPAGKAGIPFDIPETWEWCRLGSIFLKLWIGPFGSLLHKSDYIKGGTPLINPKHICDGRICPEEKFSADEATCKRLSNYLMPKGAIVMARRGEMGRCAIVQDSEAGYVCGTDSLILEWPSAMNTEFVVIYMGTQTAKNYFTDSSIGQTMQNLNKRILTNMPACLPPIAEQRVIVERVQAKLALCDKLESEITAAEQHAEHLSTAILQEVFDR